MSASEVLAVSFLSPRDDGQDTRRISPVGSYRWIGRTIWIGAAPTGSSSMSLIDVCPSGCGACSLSTVQTYVQALELAVGTYRDGDERSREPGISRG